MGEAITIRVLPVSALGRLAEIDRSEHITRGYRIEDDQLVAEEVDWQVSDWAHVGTGKHSVPRLVATWQPVVDAGGPLLGALDGARLAGLSLLRPQLRPGLAQLALLFVSRPYRRQGIASGLLVVVERLACALDARALYITATPSESAVGFYLARGFLPTLDPLPELFAEEPDDIHMVKPLRWAGELR